LFFELAKEESFDAPDWRTNAGDGWMPRNWNFLHGQPLESRPAPAGPEPSPMDNFMNSETLTHAGMGAMGLPPVR